MKQPVDCLILGCGVAGMTAAIYLRRAGKTCAILEEMTPGGQILKTSIIDNYPGLPGITGPELAKKMFDQIQALDIPYWYGSVQELVPIDKGWVVKTNVEEIETKGVIIATGRHPKALGLEKEESLVGRGISYCAICDGPFYKGEDVVVVGGGNSALEEANYLSTICKKVTLVHRRDTFKAQQYLIEEASHRKNIKYLMSHEVIQYETKDNRLTGVVVRNFVTNKTKKLKAKGLFLFIGQIPNTSFCTSLGIVNENQYILVDEHRRTKHPFLYAAGDVTAKEVFQIVTATSDGAIAATSFLEDTR